MIGIVHTPTGANRGINHVDPVAPLRPSISERRAEGHHPEFKSLIASAGQWLANEINHLWAMAVGNATNRRLTTTCSVKRNRHFTEEDRCGW